MKNESIHKKNCWGLLKWAILSQYEICGAKAIYSLYTITLWLGKGLCFWRKKLKKKVNFQYLKLKQVNSAFSLKLKTESSFPCFLEDFKENFHSGISSRIRVWLRISLTSSITFRFIFWQDKRTQSSRQNIKLNQIRFRVNLYWSTYLHICLWNIKNNE